MKGDRVMKMDTQANVKVAGIENPVSVDITSREKPGIGYEVMDAWQSILNLLAQVADVPAALIMRMEDEKIEVFLSSESEGNPYKRKESEHLGAGLYCETVIGLSEELEVPDAFADSIWKDNPDVKLNMISYLGYPLQWESGEIFGTICVLDQKKRIHNDLTKQIMREFKNIVEKDLRLLDKNAMIEKMNSELREVSLRDGLTGLYNHKAVHEFLFVEIQNAARYGKSLTVAMVDIDGFKEINDQYGHKTGDLVLSDFAELMNARLRDSDIIGRYGGDEFLIIFTDTKLEDAYGIIDRLRKNAEKSQGAGIGITISAGIASLNDKCTADELVARADEALYKAKKRGKNMVIDY